MAKWIEWTFLFTVILTFSIITVFLLTEEKPNEEIETNKESPATPSYNTVTITTENKTEQKERVSQIDEAFLEEAEHALFEIKERKQESLSDEEKENIENEINRWINDLQQYDDEDAQNLLQQFEALQEDTNQESDEVTIESEESEVTTEDEEQQTEEQEENEDQNQQQYTEEQIITIIEEVADEYNVPSWFLKAIARRESSFNNTDISYDDGIEGDENWNNQRDCGFTEDSYPHGVGLTKLTGWMYQGSPYPFCLETPDNNNEEYYYAMRMQDYGNWIAMDEVTPLTDAFDPEQNLERFLTGYAIPAYDLFAGQYPEETEQEIWRRVAFHWNKGLYQEYDPENTDYLALYDQYVEEYQNE